MKSRYSSSDRAPGPPTANVGARVDRRSFLGGLLGVGATLGTGGTLAARPERGSSRLDVAYVNARLWTGRDSPVRPGAIGVAGTRIVALGASDVRAGTGRRTRVVDLQGAFVVPGFIDAHTHFVKASLMMSRPSLRDAKTRDELVNRIAAAAKTLTPGEWLQGGSWDADHWGGELPNRHWIDAVTPDTPVAVFRYDLHMLLMNSLALRRVGIDRNTPDMPGGVIERDAQGEPTGIVKDAVKDFVLRAIGPPTDAQIDAAVQRGIDLGLSRGVTEVHTTELDWITHDAISRRRARGEPGMRFYSFTPLKDWERMAALIRERGRGDEWLRWGGLKVTFDGSLGSRTALFYEPYVDEPGTRGIIVVDPAVLERWMLAADAAGMQITVHAIGDHANDIVLDTMQRVVAANGPRDRRFRIEHAQHLRREAFARFAKQDVIASMQPYHAIDDGRWAVKRIGPQRLETTYAFHSLLEAGAKVALGSDWPVAPLDPMTGIAAAVLRETLDGRNPGGWYPEQRIGLVDALDGYTRAAAHAGFVEDRQGTIAVGRLADFVVLDRDLFAIDPHTFDQVRVLRTVVGGRERFGPGAVRS